MLNKSSKRKRKKSHGFMSRKKGSVTIRRIVKGRWQPTTA